MIHHPGNYEGRSLALLFVTTSVTFFNIKDEGLSSGQRSHCGLESPAELTKTNCWAHPGSAWFSWSGPASVSNKFTGDAHETPFCPWGAVKPKSGGWKSQLRVAFTTKQIQTFVDTFTATKIDLKKKKGNNYKSSKRGHNSLNQRCKWVTHANPPAVTRTCVTRWRYLKSAHLDNFSAELSY